MPTFWRLVKITSKAVVFGVPTAYALKFGLVGTIVVLSGIIASVALHEAGHLCAARVRNVKATQYFVGFGPTLWSRTSGELTYGIKLIPAGGFVKIVGMTDSEVVERRDESRAFRSQNARTRAAIALAGPMVNIALACVLFFGRGVFLGQTPATATAAAPSTTAQALGVSAQSLVAIPGNMPGLVDGATGGPTPADSTRVLSPVGAVRLAHQASAKGWADVLGLLAMINVFLALFNLLPLPPLDGGFILVAGFEVFLSAITRTKVRYNTAKLAPLTLSVVSAVAIMGIASTVLDVLHPVANPF